MSGREETAMVTREQYHLPLADILFENGQIHPDVGERRTDEIVDHFVGYLLHQQTFRQAMNSTAQILGDRRDLRQAAKARLVRLIDDPFYTCTYRPALMRVAGGDESLARRLGLSSDVKVMARFNRVWALAATKKCAHRLDTIGPSHARHAEAACVERVRPHVSKFAYRRARFLAMGDAGRQHEDIMEDLRIIGLRCFRWYYPFRSDMLMDNTVRATITNRGLSYVKHHTRQCRSRMTTDEHGVTTNMEASDDAAMERFSGNHLEERDAILRLDLQRLTQRRGVLGEVARFVSSASTQDHFLEWIGQQAPRAANANDVIRAVSSTNRSYQYWLGRFLDRDVTEVDWALNTMRKHVA